MPEILAPKLSGGVQFETPATIYTTSNIVQISGRRIEGGTILLRADGVLNLTVSDIEARDFGPLVRARGLDYLTVERIAVSRGRGDATYGLGIVNVTSGGFDTATFRDLVFAGDRDAPAPDASEAWAAIALKGKNAGDTGTFTIDRFDFRDLWMAVGANYDNVDGISTEGGYSGTISNGRIVNASDACLDIKGEVRVDNVYLANCRQGIKLWASQRHGLIEMGTHRFVAIIAKGGVSHAKTVYIDTLILSGDPKVPAFRAEDGPVALTIGTLVASPDQVLNAASSWPGSSVTVSKRIDI